MQDETCNTPAAKHNTHDCVKRLSSELSPTEDSYEPKKQKHLSSGVGASISELIDSANLTGIQEDDLETIKGFIGCSLESKLSSIVSSIVDGVVKGLNTKLEVLQEENASLKVKIVHLEKKVVDLENRQDKADQYSRRNMVRLSGVREVESEYSDDTVIRIARAIGSGLTLEEIDRSHRLGKPDSGTNRNVQSRPRDIIVKLTSYRARRKLMASKSKLKANGYAGVFLNEVRNTIFYQCRQLVKSESIQRTWTADGTIIVKCLEDRIHRVETQADLDNLKSELGIVA